MLPRVSRVKEGEDDGSGGEVRVSFSEGAEKFFEVDDRSDPKRQGGKRNNSQARDRTNRKGAPAHSNGAKVPQVTKP